MSEEPFMSPGEFGASLKGFLENVAAQAPPEESSFRTRLKAHFGADLATLPILEESLELAERPNLQAALDSFLAVDGRSAELLGIMSPYRSLGLNLSSLFAPTRTGLTGGPPPSQGPVQFINVQLEGDKVLACVQLGLYLIRDGEEPLAALVSGVREIGIGHTITVEVMALSRDTAERFLAELRNSMRKHSVHRGRVLSLSYDRFGEGLRLSFARPPVVERDQIVLPEGVLARVERQTLRFSRHRDALRAAGRHLKRGVLLYGTPGTGKTLTALYLIGQMRDRTVIMVTGLDPGTIAKACARARLLEPSTILLEDADVVAEERTRRELGCSPLLFELLNQVDAIPDDLDILILLTTNRPDVLEPALASRPGRIDLAIELPLPDAACRRHLFEFYARGLSLHISDLGRLVERTEGVSPAFVRELLRKAALIAADEGGELVIEDRHMEEVLHELLLQGGKLTRTLLGVHAEAPAIRS